MATHEIIIHENKSTTKDAAPYLGSYVCKETLDLATLSAAAAKLCGLSAIQVESIITSCFEAMEDGEAEMVTRFNTDLGAVCVVIKGSLASADAALGDGNSIQLALRLASEIVNACVNETGKIETDETLTKLRVDNVMDVATKKPYKVIHGNDVFRVQGFNMVLTDEGAEVYLESTLGVKLPLTVVATESKQLFTARYESAIEGGDYKLVVKSRAGDAEGPLQTAYCKVKVLEGGGVDPVIKVTSLSSPDGEDGKIVKSQSIVAKGENLAYQRDWNDVILFKWTNAAGEACELQVEPSAQTDTSFTFDWEEAFDTIPTGSTLEAVFTLHGKDGGNAQVSTQTATLVAA